VRSWLLRVRYNDCDYDLRRDIGDVRSRLQLNRRMIQFENIRDVAEAMRASTRGQPSR